MLSTAVSGTRSPKSSGDSTDPFESERPAWSGPTPELVGLASLARLSARRAGDRRSAFFLVGYQECGAEALCHVFQPPRFLVDEVLTLCFPEPAHEIPDSLLRCALSGFDAPVGAEPSAHRDVNVGLQVIWLPVLSHLDIPEHGAQRCAALFSGASTGHGLKRARLGWPGQFA